MAHFPIRLFAMQSDSVDTEIPKRPPSIARLSSIDGSLPRFSSRRVLAQEMDDDSPGERTTTPLTSHDLSNADMLIAGGVQTMNRSLAEVIEEALGAPIPSVEVRFKDLRLTARIPVASAQSKANELPTLWNQVVKGVNSFFAKQNIVEKEILQDITGSFKPGRITLVLGQPGSGKSALMKILSGRFPMTGNVTLSGDIKFNDLTSGDNLL